MINPTEADIGRSVVYAPPNGERDNGVITSFNDSYVFVRYGRSSTSMATGRTFLEWAHPRKGDVTPEPSP